jgi:antitoxin component YwqK of YwqJK toxin-antitoxin module
MKHQFLLILLFLSAFSFAQTTDAKGRKQGYWKKTDEKNHLIYEGEFKDDLPVGKFKYYYPNDSVRAVMIFKNEGKIAYAKLYHMNGKRMAEGKYVYKELKDSTWKFYDELGVLLSKDEYKQGKKNGLCLVYLPDGTVSEERRFKEDYMDGPFKEYFAKNTIKAQGNYVNGKLEGRVSYHYPNGVEVAAGYYKNGEKNGPWIYKNEKGQITEKELFKNGKLASQKETDAFFAKFKEETKAPAKETKGPKK